MKIRRLVSVCLATVLIFGVLAVLGVASEFPVVPCAAAAEVTPEYVGPCPRCGYPYAYCSSSWYAYDSTSHWIVSFWGCPNCGDFVQVGPAQPHSLYRELIGYQPDASFCNPVYRESCYYCGYSHEYMEEGVSHWWWTFWEDGYRQCHYCGYTEPLQPGTYADQSS